MKLKLKMNNFWGRFFLSAAICTIIAQMLHTIGAMLTMKYYQMPEYLSVWSKVMMPTAGPPPLSFTLYSLLFGLLGAIIFVYVYKMIKGSISGKSVAATGLRYGFIIFCIAAVPMSFTLYLLINLPSSLVTYWAFESLVIYCINGMIVAKLMK